MKSPYDQEIYSLRRVGAYYYITKWNGYLELIVTHKMFCDDKFKWHCDCAARRSSPLCRHDIIRTAFFDNQKTDTGWFYHWGSGIWEPPITSPFHEDWEREQCLSALKESIGL